MKLIGVVLAFFLAGCAALSYEPAQERNFSQIAAEGCKNRGEAFIVTGQVNKAYENSVVLWDGVNASQTMSVTLPGRGPLARISGWFGTNKYETAREQLNALGTSGTPVTMTLECRGGKVAPEAREIRFLNPDGTRTAIAF